VACAVAVAFFGNEQQQQQQLTTVHKVTMAPSRKFTLLAAVSSIAAATLLLVCVIFSPSLESAELLSSATQGKEGQQNFFAAVAPGGSIHKLPVASGNSALAKAEKKLSSYAYPRFPVFTRSPKAGPLAPKMSLSEIEHTLQTDASDLLKDAGPSHAAAAINMPRAAVVTSTPRKQAVSPAAALATQAEFPVGSPFPAKGARVIYIGGGAGPSEASERAQQPMIYVGGNSAPSNSLVDSQAPLGAHPAAGYDPLMPTVRDVLEEPPARSQRLGWDINNPTAPDMQQWRPAYRQPPLGDVDHGDSIGANDENQDNTRFSRGFRRPSLQQEFQREFRQMQAREHADRRMIKRLRGALQRVQEMSARAYTGAQAADVVLGSAAIRLHDNALE
jgi:hypothetical protein